MRAEIVTAADLIRQKEIDSAIQLLESLADGEIGKEDAGMKHLHLAIAYGKKKIVDRSDFHWRKAIEYEHPTGMAYEKLAISLSKQGRLGEAVAVCEDLISHPRIPEPRSYLTKADMRRRKEKLEKRLARNLEEKARKPPAT